MPRAERSGRTVRPDRAEAAFRAAPGLGGPHRQTLLASRLRKPLVQHSTRAFRAAAERCELATAVGVRVETWLNRHGAEAPLVVLIHGWLGDAESHYVTSAAQALWQSGFATARLNLPDHGNTAGLNESLFHSARLEEVVDACAQLRARFGRRGAGLVGFSLGGNFALRVAPRLALETLAICPAIDPDTSVRCIDGGLGLYRWFFLRKWRRSLRAKARAFPGRYDFARLYPLTTLAAVTERMVEDHTEFPDAQSYYDAYRIVPPSLRGAPVRVIAAADDPMIPAESVLKLRDCAELVLTPTGGHCSFVDSWQLTSWLDRAIVEHFQERLCARAPGVSALGL